MADRNKKDSEAEHIPEKNHEDLMNQKHVSDTFDTSKLSDINVLLAEDSPDLSLLFQYYMEKYSIQMDNAFNGKEAIKKALEKDYDIIFMDIQMPVLDGYEATKRLREAGVKTPILSISALSLNQHNINTNKEIGFNEHIAKPIKEKKLIESIIYWINK